MSNDKAELRKKFRTVRQKEKSEYKDRKICRVVIDIIKSENIDVLFVYYPVGSEISTAEIIDYALRKGIIVAFPKCLDGNGTMDFFAADDLKNQLSEGMYSIMEPDISKCSKAVFSKNSVCIVPGLAFDRLGYRLGYGKGYYDRFLCEFKGKSIGLCYNECLCDNLPYDKYDCKVDMIITEKEIINSGKEEYIYG